MAKNHDVKMRVFRPGVTALQLILQPYLSSLPFVKKNMFTTLLRVVMIGGRKKEAGDQMENVESPQLLSIKIVASPSVIFT